MMDESKKKTPAPVLTAAQQKKSITGTTKIQKRKVVLNTLDSPLDLDWQVYFKNCIWGCGFTI